jgi:uncharacterized membrane protein
VTDARRFDRDLLAVAAFAVVGAAVLLVTSPARFGWALGVPFVLVAPGYAVVAALFPATPAVDPDAPGWIVRAALTLIGSVLVVGAVGTPLAALGVLSLVPVVLALGAVTVLSVGVAFHRRRRLPADRRADPTRSLTVRALPERLGLSGVQSVALAVAVLALVGAVAATGPTTGDRASFSEATLVDGPDGGDRVDGPIALDNGTASTVYVRLTNHERAETTYTVLGQIQRVENGTVTETRAVAEEQVTVGDGRTTVLATDVDPEMDGERLRLRYLVYTERPPDRPGPHSADLTLRQWVETEGGA